jgi:quinol monooxygenase YgiN
MIIVTGSLIAKDHAFDEALALSLEHVLRSRTEPGCMSHAVHRDLENPLRLVFFEEWADRESLEAHFAVAGSRAFVKAIGALVAAAPAMQVFEAQQIVI